MSGLREEVSKLVKVIEAPSIYKSLAEQRINDVKTAIGLSADFVSRNVAEYSSEENHNIIFEKIVDIYEKRFNEEDIKLMSDFNSSPTGKKLLGCRADLTQEVMGAIGEWGNGIHSKLTEEFSKSEKSPSK